MAELLRGAGACVQRAARGASSSERELACIFTSRRDGRAGEHGGECRARDRRGHHGAQVSQVAGNRRARSREQPTNASGWVKAAGRMPSSWTARSSPLGHPCLHAADCRALHRSIAIDYYEGLGPPDLCAVAKRCASPTRLPAHAPALCLRARSSCGGARRARQLPACTAAGGGARHPPQRLLPLGERPPTPHPCGAAPYRNRAVHARPPGRRCRMRVRWAVGLCGRRGRRSRLGAEADACTARGDRCPGASAGAPRRCRPTSMALCARSSVRPGAAPPGISRRFRIPSAASRRDSHDAHRGARGLIFVRERRYASGWYTLPRATFCIYNAFRRVPPAPRARWQPDATPASVPASVPSTRVTPAAPRPPRPVPRESRPVPRKSRPRVAGKVDVRCEASFPGQVRVLTVDGQGSVSEEVPQVPALTPSPTIPPTAPPTVAVMLYGSRCRTRSGRRRSCALPSAPFARRCFPAPAPVPRAPAPPCTRPAHASRAARVRTPAGAEKAESAKKAEAAARAAEPAVPEGAAAAVAGGGGALPVAGAEALLAGPSPLRFHPTVQTCLLPHPLSSLELHSLELNSCLIPVNECTSISLSPSPTLPPPTQPPTHLLPCSDHLHS